MPTNGSAHQPRRVAVIGAGILGTCVGWHLARAGTEVVFLDAAEPGRGVTDWSFSWVNASNKTIRKSYFDLNVAGIAAHRELAATIGPDTWWYPTGHLRWTGNAEAEAKLLDLAALLADWGYRVQLCTGAQARSALEPGIAVPDDAQVVFYPDEAWVHGRNLVTRLIQDAVTAGARHRFGAAVAEIGTDADGHVRSVVLSDAAGDVDRLDVDAVVNAAGPDAWRIAELVARRLPMLYEPGAVMRLRTAEVPISRAMHAPHVELRPDGDTSVVVHSREIDALIDTGEGHQARAGGPADVGKDARVPKDPAELGRLLHAAARAAVPALGDAEVVQTRVSNRPIPVDGFPSVGAVPSIPGYFEAVSHSGITLGPVLGRLLAEEILTGRRGELLADFGPERFSV
ncbi:MAG: FAD-binding oxidoreductase [Catenulispora sp.]|nr:FAD-binding oxidoreductase [Catenulispora sp.]